jgi:hypothetical protein
VDESQLGLVAGGVDLRRRGRVAAVASRVDVPAAGQHERVHQVEGPVRCPARDDHRQAAGGEHRVDVRRGGAGDGELTPEPRDDVAGADDADDG